MKFFLKRLDTFVLVLFYGLTSAIAVLYFQPRLVYQNNYLQGTTQHFAIANNSVAGVVWIMAVLFSVLFFTLLFGAWFGRNYESHYWLKPISRISYFVGNLILICLCVYVVFFYHRGVL